MSLKSLLTKIKQTPEQISFDEVIHCITENYHYSPVTFTNGLANNQAGTNEGSCKIFYFAQLNSLNKLETLACFGKYYREDVLQNPDGDDHANIRNFIVNGWNGVNFESAALSMNE